MLYQTGNSTDAMADPGGAGSVNAKLRRLTQQMQDLIDAQSEGGPITVADGADVTLGAKADALQSDPAQAASLIALLKGLQKIVRSFDAWSASQATVSGSAGVVCAARTNTPARVVTLLNSHATDTLYLGHSAGVTTANGFPVPAGKSVALTTSAAIYGIRGGSNNITVGVIEEYISP